MGQRRPGQKPEATRRQGTKPSPARPPPCASAGAPACPPTYCTLPTGLRRRSARRPVLDKAAQSGAPAEAHVPHRDVHDGGLQLHHVDLRAEGGNGRWVLTTMVHSACAFYRAGRLLGTPAWAFQECAR